MGGLFQPTHLIIVLAIVLVLFGAKKLPEMGRGLGAGMREFKKGVTGEPEEDKRPEPDVIVVKAEEPNRVP
ncbi:MAG: twin-arginine translocase TatA/TatE family subunit [Actinobacteria bacterium]|nr:twin-arginine translocase TatA/TatE family subunit [Actinomycetota bacterium]